jgi:hypothetical protein
VKERAASTTQEAKQIIAVLLSAEHVSARSIDVYSACGEEIDENYGLGRRFEGAAKKHLPLSRAKGGSQYRKGLRKHGFWVCGVDHFERDRHEQEGITAAIHRMKNRQAFVSAESVGEIF